VVADKKSTSAYLRCLLQRYGEPGARGTEGRPDDAARVQEETATDDSLRDGYLLARGIRTPWSGVYSVTALHCAVGTLTFAHDWDTTSAPSTIRKTARRPQDAYLPVCVGHLVDGAFRTVMSYSTAVRRLPAPAFFSSRTCC